MCQIIVSSHGIRSYTTVLQTAFFYSKGWHTFHTWFAVFLGTKLKSILKNSTWTRIFGDMSWMMMFMIISGYFLGLYCIWQWFPIIHNGYHYRPAFCTTSSHTVSNCSSTAANCCLQCACTTCLTSWKVFEHWRLAPQKPLTCIICFWLWGLVAFGWDTVQLMLTLIILILGWDLILLQNSLHCGFNCPT